ncbi:unnamed protein product, partial [Ixodes persulcatus]
HLDGCAREHNHVTDAAAAGADHRPNCHVGDVEVHQLPPVRTGAPLVGVDEVAPAPVVGAAVALVVGRVVAAPGVLVRLLRVVHGLVVLVGLGAHGGPRRRVGRHHGHRVQAREHEGLRGQGGQVALVALAQLGADQLLRPAHALRLALDRDDPLQVQGARIIRTANGDLGVGLLHDALDGVAALADDAANQVVVGQDLQRNLPAGARTQETISLPPVGVASFLLHHLQDFLAGG